MSVERRLLVVEDEENVRFVLSHALQALSPHYKILAAGDATEALRLADQNHFDLMITDINLPGVDGVQLTEQLLTQAPSTAVIWITALGCRQVSRAPVVARVAACLDKPIAIGELRKVALKALRERDREQFRRTCFTVGAIYDEKARSPDGGGVAPGASPG